MSKEIKTVLIFTLLQAIFAYCLGATMYGGGFELVTAKILKAMAFAGLNLAYFWVIILPLTSKFRK